jgi:hypothetical protein
MAISLAQLANNASSAWNVFSNKPFVRKAADRKTSVMSRIRLVLDIGLLNRTKMTMVAE